MASSPNLGLTYLVASQAQKEVTHNEALNDLDSLAQLCVASRTLSVPPTTPAEGVAYIVGASPTDAWAGYAGKVALYYAGWIFKTPKAGWIAYAQSESRFVVYDGSAWVPMAAPYGSGSLVWNPGTLAAGAGATSAVIAMAGAGFGDFALVAAPYDLQGVCATSYVSAAGNVVIRLHNQTGASVTFASGTWNVRLLKA